ncbi:PH, RCC1 and FYVE domains-containing protein 1-like [Andrographis paniculata]|uniref:PH, RCC1 and FYVE domains-containing protein 1-like n=1 Tax=Andrographis paniculata TaxID=175694 RepID=UPI0021E81AB8|nr:PH, RCC1 and FYVE domains-containing protein 1-like [Andrographis paniculata]
MADPASYGIPDRDIDQALIALKKGTQLIKYSRKGKPKFKTFRLSHDETSLVWNSHGAERQLMLSSVSRITPGQRTPVFKRYLRPEKEYLSFSLIYNDGERSLDLICKDKAETEVWLAALKSLISTGGATRNRRAKSEIPYEVQSSGDFFQDIRPSGGTLEFSSTGTYGRLTREASLRDISCHSLSSHVGFESANMQPRTSGADGFRISVSSTPSCSSQGSGPDDLESLGDVYLWGEIWCDGLSTDGNGFPIPVKADILTPKPLETNIVLDVHQISCGLRHVGLVTRQGEVFTWGEESGGRLGHGSERDYSRPRLVEFLAVTNIDSIACGEFHTCALSSSGDLYTWGDGVHMAGLLGQGNDNSHWIPKRISGPLEGIAVLSVACGSWHSALVTSTGKLYTFGDGVFGALGHGDRESILYPKEVQSLSGLKVISVSCGVWHTAAIVEVSNQSGTYVPSRKLFTWGDGDKYRLGQGDKAPYLYPTCVSNMIDYNIHQIACGYNMTAVLTTSGHVFMMGNNAYGQLGSPQAEGKSPTLVQERLVGEFVEQIVCGAHHVAVLTSRSEVYTWGRGANGRLGHGDTEDRSVPTLVEALKDKVVRNIACGSNYTASICIHKWVSGADQSICTACRQAFGFTRKRHNCYNCGLVHCHACSSKKALRAALAPTPGKPHRVCDSCYLKLKKAAEIGHATTIRRRASGHRRSMDMTTSRFDRGGEVRHSRVLLSPTIEPVKYLEIKSGGARSDNVSIVRASQVPSLLQLKDIAFPSSLSALQYALKPVMTPGGVPQPPPQPPPQLQPLSNPRPASPYSRRPSPPRSATPVFSRGVIDTLKKSNDHLTQEISKLHGQVRNLKQKSEAQDTEIQKFKKMADEANAMAADKSSRCIRAMQAIKSITDQLKGISNKLPPEVSKSDVLTNLYAQVESLLDATSIQAPGSFPQELANQPQKYFDKSEAADANNHRPEYRINSAVQDSSENANGTPVSSSTTESNSEWRPSSAPQAVRLEGRQEVIEQFEPGVYVTLIQLSNGTKIYKRVRFSKRRFSEQQAEEWWKENKDRLLRKYAPTVPARISTPPPDAAVAPPPPSASEEGDEQ